MTYKDVPFRPRIGRGGARPDSFFFLGLFIPPSVRPPTRGEIARTYDEFAVEYDRTRQRPWPEAVEFAASLPRHTLVADLGCGGGRHAKVLLKSGHRVVGLDASRRLLSITRAKLPAVVVLGDLCQLPFRDAR